MGTGALALYYLGESIVFTIIFFSLTSFLFKPPVRRKQTWVLGFILVTIILAIISAFIENTIPENISDDDLITVYGIESVLIPVLVSLVYWFVIKIFFSKNAC